MWAIYDRGRADHIFKETLPPTCFTVPKTCQGFIFVLKSSSEEKLTKFSTTDYWTLYFTVKLYITYSRCVPGLSRFRTDVKYSVWDAGFEAKTAGPSVLSLCVPLASTSLLSLYGDPPPPSSTTQVSEPLVCLPLIACLDILCIPQCLYTWTHCQKHILIIIYVYNLMNNSKNTHEALHS